MYNPTHLKTKIFHPKAFVDVEYKLRYAIVYTHVARHLENHFSLLVTSPFRWFGAILQYLQCVCNAVFH